MSNSASEQGTARSGLLAHGSATPQSGLTLASALSLLPKVHFLLALLLDNPV